MKSHWIQNLRVSQAFFSKKIGKATPFLDLTEVDEYLIRFGIGFEADSKPGGNFGSDRFHGCWWLGCKKKLKHSGQINYGGSNYHFLLVGMVWLMVDWLFLVRPDGSGAFPL